MSNAFINQLSPLELNPTTGEPFLRLPAPHEHIILTPLRMSDAHEVTSIMGEPEIYRWMYTPPFPFELEHAVSWLKAGVAESQAALKELRDASQAGPDAPLAFVGGCPVRAIREQLSDGTDVYLGNCAVLRSPFEWEKDEEVRARLKEENDARKPGDPNIVWTLGDLIRTSHHNQGIMTAVIKSLVTRWIVPRMNARVIIPTVFEGNYGSMRVFEKNGFLLTKVVKDAAKTKAKGEFPARSWTINVFEYQYNIQ